MQIQSIAVDLLPDDLSEELLRVSLSEVLRNVRFVNCFGKSVDVSRFLKWKAYLPRS